MQNIEEQALQTYNENILFLQLKYSNVFNKLVAYDNAVKHGYYQEKYSLEYKDDCFNVLELSSGEWFYDTNSIEQAKKIAKSVNFNKIDNVYETYKDMDFKDFKDKDVQEIEQIDLEEHFLSASAMLLNYASKNANKKNTSMKKLYKFIFIGTGLGLHIEAIHNKLNANTYLIIENDLELFKLSLFVTNYKNITANGSQIVFSLFDDADEFKQSVGNFLEQSFIYNHYIKFYNFSDVDGKILKFIQEIIIAQGYLNFNFSVLMTSYLRPLEYLKKSYPILDMNTLTQKKIFQDKPVLLLGAGPSLSKNIAWVEKNQDKFIIVSISTILSELEKHNIKPDIITHVHSDVLSLPHIEKVKDVSFFDTSLCIFSATALPAFTDYFKKENVFIFESNSSYKDNFGNLVAENVGAVSYRLLLQLRTKEFYLLGLDFALDQETGNTHIATHEHIKNAKLEEDTNLGGSLDYEMGVVKVRGNLRDEVYSTILYRNQAFEISKIHNAFLTLDTTSIYNLSNGSYLQGVTPLKIDDIALQNFENINKDALYTHLKSILNENSENFLNTHELDKIMLEIEECNFKLTILERYKTQKAQDLHHYHSGVLNLFNTLLGLKKSTEGTALPSILTLYFQFTSGYIFDIINTKEINNPKKQMKDLNKLFVPQLTKIITHYKDKLQEYLNFSGNSKSEKNENRMTLLIEEKAVQTYNENLLYLQTYHPNIFAKLNILESAINQGAYKERFSLEYKDNAFNVLELQTSEWLYGENSLEHAKGVAQSINFSKSENVYETFKHIEVKESDVERLEKLAVEENILASTASLINYSNKYASSQLTNMKKLYKFVFIGTALGLHIQAVHDKLHSNVYFIVEDDLELFKLSLFVTNYSQIHKDGSEIIFSVMDDAMAFRQNTEKFLEVGFIYNRYIKFFTLSQNYKLNTIQEIIVSQSYLNFDFTGLLKSYLRPLRYLKDGYKILNIATSYKDTALIDKPVLLLGAGPSLSKNISWIEQNQNKFLIVAVSAILSELEKNNIKPDIITHIHGENDALVHVQKIKNISYFDSSVCVFGGMALPEFTNYFKKENVFLFEGNSSYKDNFGRLVEGNIGSLSYGLLLKLQAKTIYMLGLDFALDQKTGSTHIATHAHADKANLLLDTEIGGVLNYDVGVIKIKGNFEEEVYSTPQFAYQVLGLSSLYEELATPELKNIYNLSDGAYIDKSEALNINAIDVDSLQNIDKNVLHDGLKTLFNSKSENFLTENESKKITKALVECDKKLEIINKYKSQNAQDLNQYQNNILGMFSDMLESHERLENRALVPILELYLRFIIGYVFDAINTKEMSNPKRVMKELDKAFVPQITRIINHYKDSLKAYS